MVAGVTGRLRRIICKTIPGDIDHHAVDTRAGFSNPAEVAPNNDPS